MYILFYFFYYMDLSINDVDKVTLQYLTNNIQYENIIKKNKQINNKNYINDKRFYKKRIIDLTKRLFKNEIDDASLKLQFENFVKSSINYLKFIDKKDVYQEKYENLLFDSDLDDKIIQIEQTSCDELFFCKKEDVKQLNLDTYVKRKTKTPAKIILPKKEEVNLKNPEYKTKGIKKNINNNYGDK